GDGAFGAPPAVAEGAGTDVAGVDGAGAGASDSGAVPGEALEVPCERPSTIRPAPTAASASTPTIMSARVRGPNDRVTLQISARCPRSGAGRRSTPPASASQPS